MGGYCIGIAVEFVRQLPITTSRTIPYFTRIKEMDWVEFEPPASTSFKADNYMIFSIVYVPNT